MEGIQFVVDEKGKKTAVLIDLHQHGDIWEDFYDALVAEERDDEPRDSWETIKADLIQQGRLDAK